MAIVNKDIYRIVTTDALLIADLAKFSTGKHGLTTDNKEHVVNISGTVYRFADKTRLLLLDGTQAMTGSLDLNGQNLILDGDADSFFDGSADDILDLYLGGTIRVSFTKTGLLINTTSGVNGVLGAAQTEIYKTTIGNLLLHRESANSSGPTLEFLKRRTAWTLLSDGDDLGNITFSAADGVNAAPAASIISEVDGAPGEDDMPGRLTFSTTAAGANAVTERVRITSTGQFGIGVTPTKLLHIKNASSPVG